MKEKMKNYSFWIAVASSVMIFLQTLGTKIDIPFVDSVFNALLGIFVVLGFVDKPKNGVEKVTDEKCEIEKKENGQAVNEHCDGKE